MFPNFGINRHVAVPLLLILLATSALGQQTYVTRFDAFTGYTYLNSPHVGLAENGFHTQFGVRPWTWMSIGFDYSVSQGDLTLTPNLLLPSIQQTLGAVLAQLAAAGKLPPGYSLVVPASSTTQTFAGGPQFAYRHWKPVTLFIRPSCGIIKETATPHPGDPIATLITQQLAPSGEKRDNVIFYGFGGGIDLLFSKHFAARIQADFVHDHLFSDLLTDSRNTVRFSIGPCFNFGKNIVKK
ncbi:MAG TPA: hypothetical protein VMS37_17165 [Verrucomicrobiae bacterium]|nr:hypothetical protein [Verrucomicrobiae bacterium]